MAVPLPSLDQPALLVLLADGRLRSGEWLAKELRVSRAAVWKGVKRLRALGVDVEALPRRGYRLPDAVEMLEPPRIYAELSPEHEARVREFELLFEVDSTNTRLLNKSPPPAGRADVCMGELQHAGRGRRGRRWVAPFGAGIALSVAWTFMDGARTLPALSLAVGVAVWRALVRAGARGVALKWPNDIWFDDRKIGGVLIELRAEVSGPAHVVIGIGINLHQQHFPPNLATEPTSLDLETGRHTSRQGLAIAVLQQLHTEISAIPGSFPAIPVRIAAISTWVQGKKVEVHGPQPCTGITEGLDLRGFLRVRTEKGVVTITTGGIRAASELSEKSAHAAISTNPANPLTR